METLNVLNIENADYNISKERGLLDMAKESGFVNG